MYVGTILFSILFLLVISLIIYAWIKDKNGSEWAFDGPPERGDVGWTMSYDTTSCVELPKGSIEKLIGKKLTWRSNPVEI